jgi:hypothetical protein
MENLDGFLGSLATTILSQGLKSDTKIAMIVSCCIESGLIHGMSSLTVGLPRLLKISGKWQQAFSRSVGQRGLRVYPETINLTANRTGP